MKDRVTNILNRYFFRWTVCHFPDRGFPGGTLSITVPGNNPIRRGLRHELMAAIDSPDYDVGITLSWTLPWYKNWIRRRRWITYCEVVDGMIE